MSNDMIKLVTQIATHKENIRKAIVSAGVECPEDTPLQAYPSKIAQISGETTPVGYEIFHRGDDKTLTAETTSYTLDPKYAIVDANAFYGCESLQSVTLPKVVLVDDNAFKNCGNLTSVTAPLCKRYNSNAFHGAGLRGDYINSVAEEFGANCFQGNTTITSVSLPNAIRLGNSCFEDCISVETISIPQVKHIGAGCFRNFSTNVHDGGLLKNWQLNGPEVLTVGSFVAKENNTLSAINLPKVEVVSAEAFYYDVNLETINMPKVKRIERDAFRLRDQKSFTTPLYFPECEYIGGYAFYYNKRPSITIKDGCVIDEYAFYQNASTKVVGKPSYIGRYGFGSNSSLSQIDLSSCVFIGEYAFESCSSLEIVDLSSCTKIESYAFSSALKTNTKVWLPMSLTQIASGNSYLNKQVYTDCPDAGSRPSSWQNSVGSSGNNWHYGATYEDFLNA